MQTSAWVSSIISWLVTVTPSPVGTRQHAVEKDVHGRNRFLREDVLRFIVGDAALARSEDHRRGGHTRNVVGVMASLARKIEAGDAEALGSAAHEAYQLGVEALGAELPALQLLHLHLGAVGALAHSA